MFSLSKIRKAVYESQFYKWLFIAPLPKTNILASSQTISFVTTFRKKVIGSLSQKGSWEIFLDFGFILLIFSLVFSPKLANTFFNPAEIPIYLSDFLILVILLVMFIKGPWKNELSGASLEAPMLIFICAAAISTIKGILVHTIESPILSLFYLFKWVEYFILYYLVLNYITSKAQVKRLVYTWLCAAVLIGILGIYEHLHPLVPIFTDGYYRIYERGWFLGEANHFAGFFMLMISLCFSVFLCFKRPREQFIFMASGVIMLVAFLWTYSRQAFLSLLITLACIFALVKNKKVFFVVLLIMIFVSILFFERGIERISSMKAEFSSDDIFHSSITNRFYNWRVALVDFPRFPILGAGLGARHRAFYDSQSIMILCEMGIVGLACFLWIILNIFKLLVSNLYRHEDIFLKGLCLGLLAGFIGMIVQSTVCVNFIITRIAGPFWFLLAILSVSKNNPIEIQRK